MPVDILNPRGVSHFEENPIASRLSGIDNRVVGLIDNSKDNANLFLETVLSLISKRNTVGGVLRIRKRAGSLAAEFTEKFIQKCDYVINAFGD